MPKFKKVIRKQGGGDFDIYQALSDVGERIPVGAIYAALGQIPKQTAGAAKMATSMAPYLSPTATGELTVKGVGALVRGMLRGPEAQRQEVMRPKLSTPGVPSGVAMPGLPAPDSTPVPTAPVKLGRVPPAGGGVRGASASPSFDNKKIASMVMAAARPSADLSDMPMAPAVADRNAMADYKSGGTQSLAQLSKAIKDAAKAPGASPELAKAAGELPKTKAGMKKFMQEYSKFIALGAMAGAGGKGGQIAAPIIAALPGLIEILKGRGKGKVPAQRAVGMENPLGNLPGPPVAKAHGGSMAKKSSGGDTPKKSEGGAIRKFKGGSMNMKKDMLTPKYKKGGDMPKGKAAGEMPQHKKMAMGKPTPQSTGQKFAKGGAAKYASGGMCKGYGIAKKIRPTGPMN